MAFITGTGELKRNAMITYVDVSTAEATTPTWEAVGVKIEESAVEFNPEVNKITDILGDTHTSIDKIEPQQSFDPFTLRKESKLAEKLAAIMLVDKDLSKLSQFKVMRVYTFMGTDSAFTADMQEDCTIEVASIGGGTKLDMPITVHYSGKSTMGTVDKIASPTFTPDSGNS